VHFVPFSAAFVAKKTLFCLTANRAKFDAKGARSFYHRGHGVLHRGTQCFKYRYAPSSVYFVPFSVAFVVKKILFCLTAKSAKFDAKEHEVFTTECTEFYTEEYGDYVAISTHLCVLCVFLRGFCGKKDDIFV
jgi:hypothetical protein